MNTVHPTCRTRTSLTHMMTLTVALAALWLRPGVAAAEGPATVNLAPNPGFEVAATDGSRPAGWTQFGANGGHGRGLWVTTPAHGGGHAVGVADAVGEYAWHTALTVTAGTVYRFSAYAQTVGSAPARVQIAWFGPTHRYLGSSIGAPATYTSGWQQIAVDGTAPPMTASAELVVGTTGGGPGTAVWFDDVFFATLPATLAWATGGPEPVFSLGSPAVLPLIVTSQSPITQTLPLTVTTADAAGTVLLTTTQAITLAPSAGAASLAGPTVISVTLPATQTGWYSTTAVLGGSSLSTAQRSAAVISPTLPITNTAGGADPSPFGIGAYLSTIDRGDGTITTTGVLAALGARWDREEFRWQSIEPRPGQFDWGATDAVVLAAHRAGLSILGVLDYWSTWTQPYTTTGYTDFADFAGAVADRYRPGGTLATQQGWGMGYGVRAWEVWNEPTTLAYWTGTPAQFGMLLKPASTAIHRADAHATVMYTSFGSVGDPQVLAVAGKRAIDAIALHFYAGPVAPEEQQVARGIRAARDRTGGKPVWVTETGYAVFLGGAGPLTQAYFLIRSYAEMIAGGAQHVLWYAWRDSGQAENFGLTTGDRQPKPALVAFATMTHLLDGARLTGALPLGAALRGVTFARGATQVAVLWSTAPEAGSLTLAPGSSRLRAYNPLGHLVGALNGQSLTVPLTGQPLFLSGAGLSHGAFAALLTSGVVAGIAPVAARFQAPEAPQSSLPRLALTLTGQTNVTSAGTLTLLAPPSLAFSPTVQTFSGLRPGAVRTITFTAQSLIGLPDPAAVVTAMVTISPSASSATASVTSTTDAGQVLATTTWSATAAAPVEAPLAETVAISGTPKVDGSLSGWTAAPPVLLSRPEQLIGDPTWSPQTFSAAARLLWDAHYLYVSAVVTDTDFYEPNSGYYLYQGDSLQFDVQFGGPAPYRFGLARTPQGVQLFRYEGGGTLAPGPVTDAPMAITLRPGSPVMHIVYTVAVPWSDIGLHEPPAANSRFLANLTVNDNRRGVRADWLTLTAGRGAGFSPSPFLTWTLGDGVALGALRVGGQAGMPGAVAPTTATTTLTFTAPTTATALLIRPSSGADASALTITLNGQPISVTVPAPSDPSARRGSAPPLELDLSSQAQPGPNLLTVATPPGAREIVVTVLARP